MNYKKGKLDGKTEIYYPGGSTMAINYYKAGKQHGTWKILKEDGSVLKTIKYDNGKKIRN